MKKSNTHLGAIVCELRLSAGLSQEQLAEKAAIHRTYVSQIERGLKSPTIAILTKIAEALETKPSKILRLYESLTDGV